MATMTLYPTGGTWTGYGAQGGHSSSVSLLTSYHFKTAGIDNNNWSHGMNYAAVLEFARPSSLKYAKITSAVLHWVQDGWINDYSRIKSRFYLTKITTPISLANITYSTLKDNATYGAWISGGSDVYTNAPISHDTDITALLSGDQGQEDLKILIAAGETVYNTYTEVFNPESYVSQSACYLTITYESATQPAPTPLYPSGVTLVEPSSLLFSWQFNSSTGAIQKTATLEYKKTDAANYTVVNLTQADYSYTLNQALGVGSYQWRIKITNDADEASGYSSVAYFNIIGQPAAPIINDIANKALTEITWNTTDQQSCEIMLEGVGGEMLIHDTFATGETVFRPNMFLKGTYMFSVRVMNSSGLWSSWGQRGFTIDAAGPTAAVITQVATSGVPAVRIAYAFDADSQGAIIRRSANGTEKVLALLESNEGQFEDTTIASDVVYSYVVRTYVNGYTDSNEVTAVVHFDGVIISSDNYELPLKRSDEKYLPHSESITRAFSAMNFSGREYPVIERGEFTTLEISRRFHVEPAEKGLLDKLCREENIFYRDTKGNAFRAAIESVKYDSYMGDGYLTTINLIRLNDEEVLVNV